MVAPAAVIAALLVVMGLNVTPFHRVAAEAARQLLDPSAYVAAVLGAAS
jgi:multicomponent Na+:H+ antiporter subunit D